MSSTPVLTEHTFRKSSVGTLVELHKTVMCVYRNAHLLRGQTSSVTKEKIKTAFARLDKLELGLRGDSQDAVDVEESVRRADLFASVTSPCRGFTMYRLFSSTLDRIKHRLREVLDRVEAVGYTESDEDIQIVSELMDGIRDAVTDYQVSSDPSPSLQPSLFKEPV